MRRLILSMCIMGLVLGLFSIALAEESQRTALLSDFKGVVEIKSGQTDWIPAKMNMVLKQGDVLRTKKDSWAMLQLDGAAQTATVEIKENSQLQLAEILENKAEATQSTLLDLALGEILIKAKKLHAEKSKFEVKTPTSIVGVRGTTFSVAVEAVE
ncbi:MAG: FecR domain-containing protein [Candidatus Omnitrophica bacterium]|nr:FecR domain-containing protein [Candidatus Omnitrophota bacterium]